MRQVLTSDFHLGDDRMKLLGRPFQDGTECGHKLLQNLNFHLDMGDELIFNGDLCMDKDWLHLFDKATSHTSRRVLIKGNYDTLDDEVYLKVFDEVLDYLDIDIEHEGRKLACRVHHYPTKDPVIERFSLCGHIHGAWKVQKNMLNLSVDVHHFRPIDAEKILFYYDAICKFYDQDVWAHEHPTNQHHARDRGQAGTYWEREFGGSHKG
jgi:calcineurin-like phosphoesterase family protein